MHGELFDAMPGIEMPIEEITKMLCTMWQPEGGMKEDGHSSIRASQMNLVLHNGLKVTPEEGKKLFDVALTLAKNYPCRIIVLCPQKEQDGEMAMAGKIFSECYLGEDYRTECYCEALILSYPIGEPGFLENQLSLWLENDLPTYYYFNQVPSSVIKKCYLKFTEGCARIIYDSKNEEEDLKQIEWPNKDIVRDMAFMRLLPIRQSLGNFLSNYAPEVLVEGLEEIKIGWEKDMEHEGGKFLNWISRSLEQCGLDFKKIKIEGSELKKKSGHCLETEWKYKDHKYLKWTYCKESETAELKANFAKRDIKQVFRVKELSDDESLRAACFY